MHNTDDYYKNEIFWHLNYQKMQFYVKVSLVLGNLKLGGKSTKSLVFSFLSSFIIAKLFEKVLLLQMKYFLN